MKYAPLMIDVAGLELTAAEANQLAKPSVGGVILFSRNYQNIKQIKALVKSIRQINPKLLFATDHEGGRVQRFKNGFTHLPAMAKIGLAYDENPDLALQQAYSCGWILAAELLEIGVDFSFAPVLDLDYGNSEVIGDRAFHSQPEAIIALAAALIDGMHEAGMKCVGKHFPGHGFVAADSHLDLPLDNRLKIELENDINIFANLTNKLDAIMPAHVVYSQVDSRPAGFSKIWIKDILQAKLGFSGVIFSDDLSMQGANFIENINDRLATSLAAGCDMALICNHPELVSEVIDGDWKSSNKLQKMRGKIGKFDKITHSKHLKTIKDLL
ncbi:MAG: beta-N-acetylhexosaminidase [Candidatus Thioglobus sp.]|nr:beta-N-acetylhexosaminidase [Candidatus Thioglobus sp.]